MKLYALILVPTTLALAGHASPPSTTNAPAASDMARFMEKDLNPAFTDVSYQLFHARKPGDEPSPELLAAFERLTAKSAQLARSPLGQGEKGASFRIHAVQLQIAVRGLSEASLSQDEAQIGMWLTHVSSVCNSCHAEYRE
ncbi:hypothetical protein [Hyalangium rubrum]|uniref:Cytochrome c n=1 Tax=Hyalangium rubrum TaxID=3103134 RepID=A0ABU5H7J8_9BACT|nr:hypothetical protein [Hyalangium sp. s54d21]MDY7229271.1 hypothetical protein [Hyalangium sp. s54d21]